MKLMIYPASKEVSAFARYPEMLKEYNEVAFVTPKGWGVHGEDFCSLDGGTETGRRISTDYSAELERSDAVYITDGPIPMPPQFLRAQIEQAVNAGKKVFMDHIPERLKDAPWAGQITLLHGDRTKKLKRVEMHDPEIFTIPVPVIFVMGVGPNTNKLEVQLTLRSALQAAGYSTLSIGSKKAATFFGFDALPEAFFDGSLATREKIIALNRYFYRRYAQEKPEVMVIGIPGGIMPLNPIRYEEMGEAAYQISQAVTPDLAVLCLYAHEFSKEYFQQIQALCQYRLNSAVSHMVVSGNSMELTPEVSRCEYATVPKAVVREKCLTKAFDGVELFYALDPEEMKRLGNQAIDQLIHNI